MLTFEQLIARVGISHHDAILWFDIGKKDRATLEGHTLWFSDKLCAKFVANCWGQQMREHIPDLTIKVRSSASKPVAEKKSVRKSPFKKKHQEYLDARLGGLE